MKEIAKTDGMFEIHFRDEMSTKDRALIIAVSVRVEYLVGVGLARKLGLKEPKQTRSFGDTSQSLPFNSKLNLFLDLDGISKSEADILTKFSIIRNKFAHVLEVNTIFDCLEADKDKVLKKFFEKQYGSKIADYTYSVEKVSEMTYLFLDNVEKTCEDITTRMFEQIGNEISAFKKAKEMQFLMNNLTDFKNMSKEERLFVKGILTKTKEQNQEYDYTNDVLSLI